MVDEYSFIFEAIPCPLADEFTNALDADVDFYTITEDAWFDWNAAYMAMSV
jgi:hypothetical protein